MYFKKWKDFIIVKEDTTTTVNSNEGTNANATQTNTKPTQQGQGTNANQPQEDVSKMSGQKLQELLDKWNNAYSQDFKFQNNMPKQVKSENSIDELLVNIADEYKIKVREGITKLVEFFKNKTIADSFNGKELLIIGYTSTTASDSYNKALSLRRAKIVANAIRNLLKQSGSSLNIKFKEEGMGESPDGLIVVNDQSLDPVQLGKNAPQLPAETLEILKNSKEERQKINRRVKITLPEYKFKESTIEPEVIKTEEKPQEAEKPELPQPESIQFNLNSFILTNESQSVLTTFCNELVKWNGANKDNDKKIKNIFISSHVMRKEEEKNKEQKKDEKERDNLLTKLSLNRAKLVKDFILKKLGENNGMQIYVYPVAFKMGNNEKKVVINFEKGEHMKKAEETSRELMNEYGVTFGKFGVDTPTYDENIFLQKSTLYNIKTYMENNKERKWIPIELYYDELDSYYGLGFYKKERDTFKNDFKKLIKKEKGDIDGLEEYMQKWVYSPE